MADVLKKGRFYVEATDTFYQYMCQCENGTTVYSNSQYACDDCSENGQVSVSTNVGTSKIAAKKGDFRNMGHTAMKNMSGNEMRNMSGSKFSGKNFLLFVAIGAVAGFAYKKFVK